MFIVEKLIIKNTLEMKASVKEECRERNDDCSLTRAVKLKLTG
jgi:hypothetical protein